MPDKKQHINIAYNLKTYISFMKKYKLIVFLTIFFATMFEIKLIFDKYLFKIIIDKGTEFSSGKIPISSLTNALMILAIVFVVATIISIISTWLRHYFLTKLETNMIADLKRKYFNHLIELDHNFHVSHKTGSMISRLTRGGTAVERLTDVLIFNFVALIAQITVVILSLIYLDFISSIIVFLTVVIFIAFSFVVQKFQEDSNLKANAVEDIEKANISDIFTNIDSIKYFGKEKLIKDKYQKLSEITKKAYAKNWNYYNWMSSGQTLILGLGTFFVVLFPLMGFLEGKVTLGTLAYIYSVFVGLIAEMFGFVHGIRGFYRSMADFQDLFEYGKIQKEIKDKPNAKELKIKEGEIEFNNMTFKYGKRTIFNNFNLRIPKNKKIALVGHSGSGKTTLVKLLYRFYDINEGEVVIDGINVKDVKQECLREEMSIVPQEAVLFDDTVYNNIKFSNPKATKEELLKAIKFAQLDKVIENFPKKENTIVGERGVKLSGGEKQRVSIARAILANKKILILDEATSSLDSEIEHEIQQDLQKLMEGRTSIIIAHRLSTIMNADRIIVMKNGKIVQEGTHRQLISRPGEYRHLWSLQKGGYIK